MTLLVSNSTERRILAAMLADSNAIPNANDVEAPDDLLACAVSEGVVVLAHKQLSEKPSFSHLNNLFVNAARHCAMVSLLQEAECRRALSLLQDASIPVLLLKGSALAWWLYPAANLRECTDIDMLFSSRTQADAAARALGLHGYATAPGTHDAYELSCGRKVGLMRVDFDMHWRLVNAPMFAEIFDFDTLQEASIQLPRLAVSARGLGPAHALMHACMHRAVNLHLGFGDHLKWLYDLHLLAPTLTSSDWLIVQSNCDAHELSGICASGISAAAELFGDLAPNNALQALQAAAKNETLDASRLQDWKYMQRRNLSALTSLGARAQWVWQRLFPPVSYLRQLYGADRSVASLWLQRLQQAINRMRF